MNDDYVMKFYIKGVTSDQNNYVFDKIRNQILNECNTHVYTCVHMPFTFHGQSNYMYIFASVSK